MKPALPILVLWTALPASACAQALFEAPWFDPAPSASAPLLADAGLSGIVSDALPQAPEPMDTVGLGAADKESADPDAFKANNAQLQLQLDKIRADAWKGKGPGRYKLTGVSHIYVDRTTKGSLPTLYVNALPVAYLNRGSDASADVLKDALKEGGAEPRSIELEGHYGNTVFVIDRIRFAD